ncbi:SprT-like family-domain-containing protein [Pisolithus thermaeus]|nr:SprT-like family-domain-containing protein [Pisolithus croceorrhizus]KAI6136825.1 SprT-like family-domain-containing protein [Pisolithus sp. B1]KAI6158734.1 SprT-like family-domain-containing protein [Pisolithus thermaeus]
MSYPTKKTTEHELPTAPEGDSDTLPVPVRSPWKKTAPTSVKKSATRMSKKVRDAAEQFRREKHAADLFAELNHTVFGDGLPKDTKLEWNKRLLTTAGRARWYRSRDGIQTTKIELATKILDCDERIRNTLSHEMCHLACWVIDKNPREGHGQLFKSWADKITLRYPGIQVSTRHNYQIMHPYQWRCTLCSKVYGRYSKSIKPEECMCGVCKVGKLIPLFSRQTTGAQRTGIMASLIPSGEETSKGAQFAIPVSPSLSAEEVLADALEHLSIERRKF